METSIYPKLLIDISKYEYIEMFKNRNMELVIYQNSDISKTIRKYRNIKKWEYRNTNL